MDGGVLLTVTYVRSFMRRNNGVKQHSRRTRTDFADAEGRCAVVDKIGLKLLDKYIKEYGA
jgi:hypothetical protein